MKISLNQLRFYRDTYDWAGDPAPEGVGKLVAKIGAQLGAVEEVVDFGKKYEGVVIAKVVKCEKHPNADRLNVCMIDAGKEELVQVVCGAPNVREGLTVAWLPPGSTVPETYDKDPFVLEARELRGVVSNGMLASAKELAISDSHEGILEIEEDIEPGTLFVDAFKLRDDAVIDVENKMFTHRPDCFGMIGVAREIAGIQGQKFTSPDWYSADTKITGAQNELPVQLQNELPELVLRFVLLPMANVTVRQSPVWLQMELLRLGSRPINNIVDLTNYYMLLTGQPLHAYDYDKVKARSEGEATIVVRHPHAGEKIKLLNGKEIEPRAEAIMIATDKELIGIGGVMGGADTEVDENTKNIILEAANFDMYSIRRTSMAHGLFTDAVTRFNKGQSPLQNVAVIAKIAEDVRKLAGGQIAGQAIDDNHLLPEVMERGSLHSPVQVSAAFINERLGLNLNTDEIVVLLENVEFRVEQAEAELTITAPFWRTDIEIPEDIVEEVGRLYGYDHLPQELPKRTITPAWKHPLFEVKAKVRDVLSKAGANEVLTYSFVHGNLLDKVGQDKNQAFSLSNALSPDLQYYRLSLTPSLLDKVHSNIKAGHEQFVVFEFGIAHGANEIDDEGLPKEFYRIAAALAASGKSAKNLHGAPYYGARRYVMELFDNFGMSRAVNFVPLEGFSFDDHAFIEQMIMPFEPRRSAMIYFEDTVAGVVGEYKPAVRKALKLPEYSAGFELFASVFPSVESAGRYIPLPRFPKITQDLTLRVSADLPHDQLRGCVNDAFSDSKPLHTYPELTSGDIFQKDADTAHKNVTFHFSVASFERTLREEEMNKMLDAIAAAAKEKFGAERV